jgi:hypothetical protein
VLQKRVNDFRTQKETMKAQYTAAKAVTSVNESTAGISKSFNDSGAALQRAQDKIATMQARSGALDELLESGVLEDVGGGATTSKRSSTRSARTPRSTTSWPPSRPSWVPAPPEPEALAAAPARRGGAASSPPAT